MNAILRVSRLKKMFRSLVAVDDLDFEIKAGEVYGFLGQNGAGKSTTIRMLLTLIRPDRGQVSIFGKDPFVHRKEVLSSVGAIIEKPDLYIYLTAYQNLVIWSRLNGSRPDEQKIRAQLEMVGLAARADSKVKTFSQGMKQRLGLACALIHDPRLLILDEPTNGLDPQGIADMRNLILHLSRNENKTILVSSHLLSEIEQIADSMLIIDKGKKVAEGRLSDLFNPADSLVHLKTSAVEQAAAFLKESAWSANFSIEEDQVMIRMHRDDVPVLARLLVERDIPILSLGSRHSLEAYFLSITTPGQHVAAFKN